jgi:hypothetical protein
VRSKRRREYIYKGDPDDGAELKPSYGQVTVTGRRPRSKPRYLNSGFGNKVPMVDPAAL